MINNLVVLGPGKTSLEYTKRSDETVLAFQEVFPNCVEHLGVVPDYWFGADPNSYISGLEYLLRVREKAYDNIKIIVPDVFFEDLSVYRKYFGTTPLMRQSGAWQNFHRLLAEVSKQYKVIKLPVVTTKYLSTRWSMYPDLRDIFSEEYVRFMSEKVIFGTVEFDSESVIGDKFKWGLENKLTSSVLPVCYYLRASVVKLYGFDFQGPRFYSDISRHPWNDETQEGTSAIEYSLNLLKKWVEWESIHGMKIVTGTKDKINLPSQFLDYVR